MRAAFAIGTVLSVGISMASCSGSGSNGSPPADGTGGATSTGGQGPDASIGGSGGGSPDSGAGGASGATTDGGGGMGTGGVHDQINPATCGNGQLDQYEECDDGNKKTRDGCENSCHFTCTGPNADGTTNDSLCQISGVLCAGRYTCDAATHTCVAPTALAADGTRCGDTSVCQSGKCVTAKANCGDEIVIEPTEECDPPDPANGCGADCKFVCVSRDPTRNCISPDPCAAQAVCNDQTHTCKTTSQPAKDLDPCTYGGTGTRKCQGGVCTDKYCTNHVVDPGEECDDGNLLNGDGCDKTCEFSCLATDTKRDCHSTNSCIQGGTCQANHTCSADTPKTAGTACGTKQNCVQGNCITPICGDGIVAVGVEACDDGNAVNGDGCDTTCKKSCVNPLTDCPNTPPCRTAVCTNGKCDSTPDGSKDGSTCKTGSVSATCNQGACTSGTCGDGTVQAGEQCDDANLTPADGCEANCTFTCSKDADCNDGDPCNGAETCDGSHKCVHPAKLADGTSCGTNEICVSGSCRPAFCGDGIVSGTEGCDPPNTIGCDNTCKPRALCDLDKSNWALKVVLNVTWGDGNALVVSSGVITQWAKLTFTQTGLTFTAKLLPCGLTIPPFRTTDPLNGEWYGLTFPDTAWNSAQMPTFSVTGNVSSRLIGATFDTTSTAILIGATTTPPDDPLTAAWPATSGNMSPFAQQDSDNDAKPGITANVITGSVPTEAGKTYQNIIVALPTPVDFTKATRADSMFLAIRQIAAQSGIMTSCDTMSGTTTARIDNHIIGCTVAGESRDCTVDEYGLPDAVRPLYVVDPVAGASFTGRRLTGTTNCAAVRQALP